MPVGHRSAVTASVTGGWTEGTVRGPIPQGAYVSRTGGPRDGDRDDRRAGADEEENLTECWYKRRQRKERRRR